MIILLAALASVILPILLFAVIGYYEEKHQKKRYAFILEAVKIEQAAKLKTTLIKKKKSKKVKKSKVKNEKS